MMRSSEFVEVVEKRQGIKIGCPEEAAYNNGLISLEQLIKLADEQRKSSYGEYLHEVIKYQEELKKFDRNVGALKLKKDVHSIEQESLKMK